MCLQFNKAETAIRNDQENPAHLKFDQAANQESPDASETTEDVSDDDSDEDIKALTSMWNTLRIDNQKLESTCHSHVQAISSLCECNKLLLDEMTGSAFAASNGKDKKRKRVQSHEVPSAVTDVEQGNVVTAGATSPTHLPSNLSKEQLMQLVTAEARKHAAFKREMVANALLLDQLQARHKELLEQLHDLQKNICKPARFREQQSAMHTRAISFALH